MTVKQVLVAALVATHLGAAVPALAKDADPVAATIDGFVIRVSDVEEARALLPQQLQGQPLELVYPMLLDSLINSHLAAVKARKLGYDKSPEYKKRMARIEEQILERTLLTKHIEKELTDERLQQRYGELKKNLAAAPEVHGRHILLKTQDAAMDVIKKLQGGGDFAILAKAHSIGPSAESGGDLGWFGPGRMVPAFDNAAMALETGAYTNAPVQTQFGWHIIKVEARRPASIPEFSKVRLALANELSAEIGQTLLEELRAGAQVKKVDWQELK